MIRQFVSIVIASILLVLLVSSFHTSPDNHVGYVMLDMIGMGQHYNVYGNVILFLVVWAIWGSLVKNNKAIWVNWVKVTLTALMLISVSISIYS